MLKRLKNLFKPKQCYFCKRKQKPLTEYYLGNEKVAVCNLCIEYAERRALKKV